MTEQEERARLEEENRENFLERSFREEFIETFLRTKNLELKAKTIFQCDPFSSCDFY